MLSSVFAKSVADRRRATLISVALVGIYGAVAVIAYDALGDTVIELIETMPPALAALYGAGDGTALGMAISAVYSIIAPAVVLTYAIGGGSGAAVGEESRGTMDLLLSNPVSRTSVLASKASVVAGGVAVVSAATWLGVVAATLVLDGGVGERNVVALSVMLIGLGWMMGALALAISGWSGVSALGTGVAASVALASFLLTTVFSVNDAFETIGQFTPWYLYSGNDPMVNGVDWLSLAIMLGSTALLTLVGILGVNRRDLRG